MADINAVSASNADIQTAVDSAVDGDRVLVPSGTVTWTGNVTVPNTKGITLQGDGTGSTIITTGGWRLLIETLPTRQPLRVTRFRFKHSNANEIIIIMGTAKDWRVDNNIFDGDGISGCYSVTIGHKGNENENNYNYGVIDHNSFINRNFATSIHVSWVMVSLDIVSSGDSIWALAAQRGTAQAVYVEDNIFSDTPGSAASQVIDGQYGAKYVVRYNTIHNPWLTTHSGCTNAGRNQPWVEFYSNTFTDDANFYTGDQLWLRSSSGVILKNTSAATLNKFAVAVDHERSYTATCSGAYGARCDGTRSFDENVVGGNGYRGLGQPGWGQPQVSDMSAYTFQGVFAWENRDNGTLKNLFIENNNPFTSDHLQFGRELFNNADVTSGPIANRPSTASVGPPRSVYISTDENTLGAIIYVATAPDVWTKHWEPYAYPHTLVSPSTSVSPTIWVG